MNNDERVWVLDTEGNGSSPGEIIELAAVEMIGLSLTGKYHLWRFKPQVPVNYSATRVHGITNADLKHSPRIEDKTDDIRAVLEDHAIAGHAVHVELDALQRALPGWAPTKAYDTLRISRRLFPDLERHRLGAMGDHLGLSDAAKRMTGKKAHSAFYDALLCGLILRSTIHPMSAEERIKHLGHAEIMAFRREREARAQRQEAKNRLRQLCRAEDFTRGPNNRSR